MLSALTLGCASVPPADSQHDAIADLQIRNVIVIDAVSGVRENQTVSVVGGKIVGLSPGDTTTQAKRVIDGTGKYLIPGLWDMHVHITYEDALTESMPELFLRHGITSVRDTGGLLHELAPEIARWRAPDAIAPNIYFSGPLLDGKSVVYNGDGRPEIGVGNASVEMARQNVAALQAAGVDFIKIYELVSPDVFDALVAAAEQANLPIAAHVPLALSAFEAGPQVGSMEHLRNIELGCASTAESQLAQRHQEITQPHHESGYALRARLHQEHRGPARSALDEDRCNALAQALVNTIQVPTLQLNTFALYPIANVPSWEAALALLPQELASSWLAQAQQLASVAHTLDQAGGQWSLDLVTRLNRFDVPLGAGTDTPILFSIPGYSLHTELERLVEAGLSPMQALKAATVTPATFLNLQAQMGQVAKYFDADLVLLRANPLEQISNTREIDTVVSRGRVVYQAQP